MPNMTTTYDPNAGAKMKEVSVLERKIDVVGNLVEEVRQTAIRVGAVLEPVLRPEAPRSASNTMPAVSPTGPVESVYAQRLEALKENLSDILAVLNSIISRSEV